MGKSKTAEFKRINDGGFVPRQSSLMIERYEKEQNRKAREAKLVEERKKWDRWGTEYLAKEKERRATDAERLKVHEEELRRKQEEFNKPLPEFAPRIPQEVRGKFFQYVARVVSDALWNLENRADDPFGDERENAAILGEKIPPPKPPRKKVPAECLKAALRVSTLKMGGLTVRIYIFIDVSHSCFNEIDRVWLGVYSYSDGSHFDSRIEYRIKRNLWRNVPYFVSFDPGRQEGVDPYVRVIEWDVHREQEGDFAFLKKSGFCYPGEDRVVHLEIF